MKFHQLGSGARFEHRGTIYRKTSPLQATSEPDGEPRLIPRSAAVTPLDEAGRPVQQRLPETLPADRVMGELEQLVVAIQAAARRLEPPLGDLQRAQLEQATRAAIKDLLTRLSIDG